MSAKVSVIIPVYNVENYIEECLDSLVNQTLPEIEIICVDDGSTDGTLEILRRYEAEDTRVKVIQQQNQYAGVARNNGLEHATGKYVIFLDSDDFFADTLLEKTYNEAERCEADIVLCEVQIYDEGTGELKPMPWAFRKQFLPKGVCPFNRKDVNGRLLEIVHPAPWNKLFNRKFVEDNRLRFQPLQNSNDLFFSYTAASIADKISYVEEVLISYRRGMKTSLQSTRSLAPYCFFEAYHAAFKELNARGVYEDVRRGFNAVVIDGFLYNYEPHKEAEIKHHIIELFNSDRCKEMNLFFCEEGQKPSEKYRKLQGLIAGYVWKEEFRKIKTQTQIEVLAKAEKAEKIKVSVIIPCYDVEAYVGECLDCIVNQTLQDIEIICVNDGSTDDTLNVLMKYAAKDNRITVLNQANAKQAVVRNRGAEIAKGEYIYFMDSDDKLELNALEYLFNKAKNENLELVCFDGKTFFESEELQNERQNYEDYYIRENEYSDVSTGIELMCRMVKNNEYRQQPCLLFMNRQYFLDKKLWFTPGIYHEDNPFVFNVMLNTERLAYIKQAFFNRRIREGSVMTQSKKFDHAYGYFASYVYMLEFAKKKTYTEEQEEYVGLILERVLNNARKTYRLLDAEEKYKYQCLNGIERRMFYGLVAHSKFDLDEQVKLKKELQDTIKSLKQREKKLRVELAKANSEKKKLQVDLTKIKKSRTYKLALIFRKPVALLKRIYKKIKGK